MGCDPLILLIHVILKMGVLITFHAGSLFSLSFSRLRSKLTFLYSWAGFCVLRTLERGNKLIRRAVRDWLYAWSVTF